MRVLGILCLFFCLLACNNQPAKEQGLSIKDLKFPFVIGVEPYSSPAIPDMRLLPKSDNRYILANNLSKLVCIWPKSNASSNQGTDTSYYDINGNLTRNRQIVFFPSNQRFEYDSLGFLTRFHFFNCVSGDYLGEYKFDNKKRELYCIWYRCDKRSKDIIFLDPELYSYDTRTGEYINKIPEGFHIYSFDTSGYLTELISYSNIEYFYTIANLVEKYQFAYDSAKRIVSYSSRLWLKKGSRLERDMKSTPYPFTDSLYVQYYYHGSFLDSIRSSKRSTKDTGINRSATTFFNSKALPILTKQDYDQKLIYQYAYIMNGIKTTK